MVKQEKVIMTTCTRLHGKGTATFALSFTNTFVQRDFLGKSIRSVSDSVDKFWLLTVRLFGIVSYRVPAPPLLFWHDILLPPAEKETTSMQNKTWRKKHHPSKHEAKDDIKRTLW